MPATDRPSRPQIPYAPFDVVNDASEFDLTWFEIETPFGVTRFCGTSSETDSFGTVFLHGVGGAWSAWTPVLLAGREQGHQFGSICLIDLPGFGSSKNSRSSLPADDVSLVILQIVEKMGWARFSLVGHSMGGFLALHLASTQPTSLQRVFVFGGTYLSVLQSVNAPISAMKSNRDVAINYLALSAIAHLGPLASPIMHAIDRSGALTVLLKRGAAHPDRLPPRFVAGLIDGLRPKSFIQAAKNGKNYDAIKRWNNISVPCIAAFGDRDRLVPAGDKAEIERLAPTIETKTIYDCGHFSPVERPFEVLDILT